MKQLTTNPRLFACFLGLCAAALLVPELAVASTSTESIFGSASPLKRFRDFILGPFAWTLFIVGIVVSLGILVIGGEFNSFGRRSVMVFVAGGILLFAEQVVKTLYDGQTAANVLSSEVVSPWTDTAPTEDAAK